MKIGMLQPRLDRLGGAENVVLWLSQGLKDRGHDVRLVTRRFDEKAWETGAWDGLTIDCLEGRMDRLRTRRGRAKHYAKLAESLLKDVDVMVAHNYPATAWATLARTSQARRVWYCHEPFQRLHWTQTMPHVVEAAKAGHSWARGVFANFVSKLENKRQKENALDLELDLQAAKSMDLVLANSAFTAANAKAVYQREVVPCLLGLPQRSEFQAEAKSGDGDFITWVSSSLPYKNAFGFIEAVRIAVHEKGASDLIVRVVGLKADEFGDLARELGLEKNLIFEGRVSYDRLQTLLSDCRFLAYPTIDEPFGIVPLEAMAHGRAVLASNIGGPRESVLDGETGLAADPLNPGAFATALIQLWNKPDLCNEFGKNGKARFEKEFTLPAFLDRFEAQITGQS
jgi:glycosyltransferase involved in cell wall biosynthesis